MTPWLFNVYIELVMKELKMGMGKMRVRFSEEGREWKLLGFLFVDDLYLCGETEKDLKVIVGCSVDVCSRMCLKFIAYNSKVMVLGKAG